MQRPPGPQGGFAVGNGLTYDADRLGFLATACREFGDLWAYDRTVYVAAGAELSRAVLNRTTYEFGVPPGFFPPPRRPRHAPPPDVERVWVHAARMRGLRPAEVRRRLAPLAEESAALAESWPSGGSVEVLPRVREALSRIGARFLFGVDAEELVHGERELFRLRETFNTQLVRLPHWVPAPTTLRIRRQQAVLGRRVRAVLRRRRADGADEPDVLGAMMRPSSQYGLLADDTVVGALVGLMIAGHEVPTRALGWILFTLAGHPGAQERIAAEAACLPDDPGETAVAHLDALEFTTAFVREVLRVHPPTWLLARTVVQGTELGGYPLCPGMRVMVSPYLLHHDGRYHPEPDRFDPGRWLPGTTTVDTARRDHGYLPFGTGPRACDGAALALTELVLVTAHLMRRHHLTVPSPTPYRLDTNGGLTPVGLTLTTEPRR
ncbi:cytochrome P450 [Actinosynnema sp. NPDC051121]|nr:cytochrome P450 [Saccharothrix sp.]